MSRDAEHTTSDEPSREHGHRLHDAEERIEQAVRDAAARVEAHLFRGVEEAGESGTAESAIVSGLRGATERIDAGDEEGRRPHRAGHDEGGREEDDTTPD